MAPASARCILVVEDDAVIREVLALMLETEGFTVIAVEDGEAALGVLTGPAAATPAPCLMLLDLMLPKLSGVEVLHQAHARGAEVPVVAMSANREYLAEAVQAGAQVAVAKPFEMDQMLAIVASYC